MIIKTGAWVLLEEYNSMHRCDVYVVGNTYVFIGTHKDRGIYNSLEQPDYVVHETDSDAKRHEDVLAVIKSNVTVGEGLPS